MLRFLLWIFGFTKGGEMHMPLINIIVGLIIAKRRTFAQVPDRDKEQVKADLYALGYDENGDLLSPAA